MVRIRLRRMGAKKNPFYRIVIADQQSPRDGRFIEIVGTYDPKGSKIELKRERIEYWIGTGASPSDSVVRLLKNQKLLDDQGKVVPTAPVAVA
ncbi:MAG: 30S ribosomal protein S16 [Caldilineaceae bacterium]